MLLQHHSFNLDFDNVANHNVSRIILIVKNSISVTVIQKKFYLHPTLLPKKMPTVHVIAYAAKTGKVVLGTLLSTNQIVEFPSPLNRPAKCEDPLKLRYPISIF